MSIVQKLVKGVEAALGGTVLAGAVLWSFLRSRVSGPSHPGRRLLILDASYSLHLIQSRGLETAVQSRDLGGFFEKVWTCHPYVGAAEDHPPETATGSPGVTDLGDGHTMIEGRIGRSERLDGFPILNFGLAQAQLFRKLSRTIEEEDIDAIRIGDPHVQGILGILLSKIHDVPLVLRVNGDFDWVREETGEALHPGFFGSQDVERKVEDLVFPRLEYLIGANENALDFASRHGAEPEEQTVVYYGNLVHPLHFEEPDGRAGQQEVRSELGLRDAPVLVYVGRLEPIKRAGDLVPALSEVVDEFPDAQLVLVGDGSQREAINEQARQLGVEDNLLLPGYRDQEWIGALLSIADVGVSPHMGRALVEVMLGRTPVVAYDVDWQAEAVQDGETGAIVPDGDPAAMGQAVVDLLASPKRREEMARRARTEMEERMDPERLDEQEREFYRSVLSGGV